MEYNSAKERKKIVFGTTWVYLEAIILNEVSQRKTNTEKYKYYMISLTCGIKSNNKMNS